MFDCKRPKGVITEVPSSDCSPIWFAGLPRSVATTSNPICAKRIDTNPVPAPSSIKPRFGSRGNAKIVEKWWRIWCPKCRAAVLLNWCQRWKSNCTTCSPHTMFLNRSCLLELQSALPEGWCGHHFGVYHGQMFREKQHLAYRTGKCDKKFGAHYRVLWDSKKPSMLSCGHKTYHLSPVQSR